MGSNASKSVVAFALSASTVLPGQRVDIWREPFTISFSSDWYEYKTPEIVTNINCPTESSCLEIGGEAKENLWRFDSSMGYSNFQLTFDLQTESADECEIYIAPYDTGDTWDGWSLLQTDAFVSEGTSTTYTRDLPDEYDNVDVIGVTLVIARYDSGNAGYCRFNNVALTGEIPTQSPTEQLTTLSTHEPTDVPIPTTSIPSSTPTKTPTKSPSKSPNEEPTPTPSSSPTPNTTFKPSSDPTGNPISYRPQPPSPSSLTNPTDSPLVELEVDEDNYDADGGAGTALELQNDDTDISSLFFIIFGGFCAICGLCICFFFFLYDRNRTMKKLNRQKRRIQSHSILPEIDLMINNPDNDLCNQRKVSEVSSAASSLYVPNGAIMNLTFQVSPGTPSANAAMTAGAEAVPTDESDEEDSKCTGTTTGASKESRGETSGPNDV